jgi:hypothetical protein
VPQSMPRYVKWRILLGAFVCSLLLRESIR